MICKIIENISNVGSIPTLDSTINSSCFFEKNCVSYISSVHAFVAQLVERRFYKARVTGSSPVGSTKFHAGVISIRVKGGISLGWWFKSIPQHHIKYASNKLSWQSWGQVRSPLRVGSSPILKRLFLDAKVAQR